MKRRVFKLAIIFLAVTLMAVSVSYAGITERVSVDSFGNQSNGYSLLTSISPDGRYVAFVSGASNLVPGDTNNTQDIFVHDRYGELVPDRKVTIDVKPGSYPNSINLKSKGVIPVAVFTTDDFDATSISSNYISFAGAPAVKANFEDINNDGRLDIIFYFSVGALKLNASSTSATLVGMAGDTKTIVTGTDSVRIVH